MRAMTRAHTIEVAAAILVVLVAVGIGIGASRSRVIDEPYAYPALSSDQLLAGPMETLRSCRFPRTLWRR